ETGSLSLTNSIVGASTYGAGNAGEVQIKATNSITLVSDSEKSGLIVDTNSSGDAGSLFIDTSHLSITNSVIQASTHGPGKGGNVQIKANSIAFSDGSELNVLAFSGSSGDAGSLAIDTGSLSLTNSSFISAGTEGSGEGGDIQIQANDITLEDESSLDVSTIGSGDAGSLFIETGSLSLTNNAFIASFTQ
ncbi:filamentous hemagglutinin outer membrane protein, partial [Candidatus Thiomargarita nelsonii]